MGKKVFLLSLSGLILLSFLFYSCGDDSLTTDNPDNDVPIYYPDSLAYNPDWTFATHGKAEPDYSIVFPQNKVNRIEISMTASQWSGIKTNMKNLYGYDFGNGTQGGGKGPNSAGTETDYFDVLVKFNGKTWKNVGFRLKGNSSLTDAWRQGIYKLPFKLNFDKFEDTYKGITNQHFYGFKELSFSSGFKDQSLIREKITPDIFRLAGIPAAQTAFYSIYIDFGSGSKYCGVYTVVEVPEDNMIKKQFGEKTGNIYKPESSLVSFNKSLFDKKNNETEADYSDVQAFITALNSSLRLTNPQQWRANLEKVFNVEHFISYLAVNNAIVNWDSYGIMAHNYYLYNHSSKKLTWIPWDHNEALSGSPGITGTITQGAPGGGGHNGLSLSLNEVSASWPLIRYIADDEVYFAKYKTCLKQFKENIFTESTLNSMIDNYYQLIAPFAIGAGGEQTGYTNLTGSSSFNSAFTALKTHVTTRRNLITVYVP